MRVAVVPASAVRRRGRLDAKAYVHEPERDVRERTVQRYRIYELRPCPECEGTGNCDATIYRDGKPVEFRAGACQNCRGACRLPVCVAAVGSLEGIGLALSTLAEDDRAAGGRTPCRGVKDDLEGHWIASLWPDRGGR